MREQFVGTYELGLEQVTLFIRTGTGGEFWMKPAKGELPRIGVGVDGNWHEVVSTLMHEAFEMMMTKSHCRLSPDPDYGRDHSSYIFVMTHPMFSDITARVAGFLAVALPDLSTAFKKFRKKTKRKKR